MSKLVVKIRDDDKYFPHCPLHHEGYCHLPQTHYRKDNALYMIECLGTINKRPPWCPLKEEKEAIPVEWIVKRINYYSDLILTYPNEKELLYSQTELISLLEEWEKENEM